jgi:hypothetical protein
MVQKENDEQDDERKKANLIEVESMERWPSKGRGQGGEKEKGHSER